jgi:hypothetical protein
MLDAMNGNIPSKIDDYYDYYGQVFNKNAATNDN